MSYSRREVVLPERPILIVAVEGWIDPGFAAQSALAALLEQIPTRTLAAFNGDDLIDHRARRPRARVRDGERGRVIFPAPRLRVGRDLAGMGVTFLVGPEPDYRWYEFANEVTGLALELGCPLVVGLGAYPSPVPHTRPIAISSTASSPELAARVGFRAGSIEVPAGVGEIVGAFCADAGIPSVGIWAGVPHYVGAMPYGPASLALVEALISLTDLAVDLTDLRNTAASSQKKVNELIAQSEEHKEMVRQLEEQYSEEHPLGDEGDEHLDESMLPSSEELMDELDRYLRGEFGA